MAQKFVTAMTKLGYVEGKDIEYVHRYPTGDYESFVPQLAVLSAELARSGLDAIVADGTFATNALVRATSTIPIVTNVGDPVGAGFAKSLVRPGGNVTGVALASHEVYEKTFAFLKVFIPGNWTLAIVVGGLTPNVQSIFRAVEDGARKSAIPIRTMSFEGNDARQVDRALASMRGQGIRVLSAWALMAGIPDDASDLLFATKYGLATAPAQEDDVARGALLSYEPSGDAQERKAFQLARILRGTPPGEIPFETPTTYRLAINRKTARLLGLAIPRELEILADRIYE